MELKQLREDHELAHLILKKHKFCTLSMCVLVVLNDQVVIYPLSNLWTTTTRLV